MDCARRASTYQDISQAKSLRIMSMKQRELDREGYDLLECGDRHLGGSSNNVGWSGRRQ